jgi:hypothetical protein
MSGISAAPRIGNSMKYLLVVALHVAWIPAAHAAFRDCLFFDGMDGETLSAPAGWRGNLHIHDCARKSVVPAAHPPIPILRWSPTLAVIAQAYASLCTWGHSGRPGENLYAEAPWTAAQTAAADLWADEQSDYDYSSNSCAAGEVCGHYTQMVWRSTREIGCGIANCSTGSPFGAQFPNWTYVVCNYNPPGNYSGQRPY